MLERFPFVGRVYATAEDLLADPAVRYVDIATGPEGRLDWIEAAVAAGKHVLAQKPLTLSADDLARLPAVLARAEAAGRARRGEPQRALGPALAGGDPARRATGAIGQVVGVTHLHDKALPPLAGTPFDDVPHMLLTDYLLHWVDITRSWLHDGGAGPVTTVQASDSRVPGQPAEARNPWSATLSMATASGATATLRIAGNVVASEPGCPFWVHGTDGDAARQRAAGLRPARARRRLHAHLRAAARRLVRRRLRRGDGRADVRGGRGPAAGELRRRRGAIGRAGAGRPRLGRAGRRPRPAWRCGRDRAGRGRRRGAGRPCARSRVRRGLAELESGHLVPRRRRRAGSRTRSGST